MIRASIFDIPKAASSDRNTTKDPYAADACMETSIISQRAAGTFELVTRAWITSLLNPTPVRRRLGSVNLTALANDTATFA